MKKTKLLVITKIEITIKIKHSKVLKSFKQYLFDKSAKPKLGATQGTQKE